MSQVIVTYNEKIKSDTTKPTKKNKNSIREYHNIYHDELIELSKVFFPN